MVAVIASRRILATAAFAAALAAAAATGCHRAPAGVVTVRFWAFGREGEEVRALVPEFERTHPRIRIDVQQIPWTAAHEKLLTAFVGRVTPDAAQLGNTWIPELAALGALAPLDVRLDGNTAVPRDDFFAGIWDGNVVGGTTWGVPWYVDTRLLFYRTDLVAKTGLPWPPRSWAAWRQVMERIREQGGAERYAILLPIDEWNQPVVLGLQNGATLLDTAGARGRFRDPRFRRAMGFYLDLYKSGLAPPLDRSGLVNLYQQFAEGWFAMVITGPWNLGEFARRIPADQQGLWATAALPPPDETMPYPGASVAGGSSLVVFRRVAPADAAWQWLEFLSQPAQQARFYKLTGDLPARRSAWGQTDLAADPKARPFLVQLGNAVPVPKVPEWERIATRVADRAEQGARGGKPLDEVLAGLDADADRILEKRRWMLARARAELGLPGQRRGG